MLIPVLLFCVGLVFLIKGGDWFVDGATGIAHRFRLPELLIGATVVSIGTTLPEVMVSATSALSGHGEIAYGNAIGSIICNTALIAAITVAVRPGKVDPKTLKLPVGFFFAAAILYAGIAYTTGYFSRPVGLIFLLLFVVYMIATVRQMKSDPATPADDEVEEDVPMRNPLLLLVAGAVLIAIGANLLVNNGRAVFNPANWETAWVAKDGKGISPMKIAPPTKIAIIKGAVKTALGWSTDFFPVSTATP